MLFKVKMQANFGGEMSQSLGKEHERDFDMLLVCSISWSDQLAGYVHYAKTLQPIELQFLPFSL